MITDVLLTFSPVPLAMVFLLMAVAISTSKLPARAHLNQSRTRKSFLLVVVIVGVLQPWATDLFVWVSLTNNPDATQTPINLKEFLGWGAGVGKLIEAAFGIFLLTLMFFLPFAFVVFYSGTRLDPVLNLPDDAFFMRVVEVTFLLLSTTYLSVLVHLQFLELPFYPFMGLEGMFFPFQLIFAGLKGMLMVLPIYLLNKIST